MRRLRFASPATIGRRTRNRQPRAESENDEEPTLEMIGLGGMIKRPAGFDPEHGDWEYFYANGETHLQSGPIATCVDCHTSASDRDYVFGKWGRQNGGRGKAG